LALGIVRAPHLPVERRQAIVRRGVGGLQLDGLFEQRQRLVRLIHLNQRLGQTKFGIGIGGLQRNGFRVFLERLLAISLLCVKLREPEDRFLILWILQQCRAIFLFGFFLHCLVG